MSDQPAHIMRNRDHPELYYLIKDWIKNDPNLSEFWCGFREIMLKDEKYSRSTNVIDGHCAYVNANTVDVITRDNKWKDNGEPAWSTYYHNTISAADPEFFAILERALMVELAYIEAAYAFYYKSRKSN